MDANRPVSYDMSHYFGMLRRHWWIIALFTAALLYLAQIRDLVKEAHSA